MIRTVAKLGVLAVALMLAACSTQEDQGSTTLSGDFNEEYERQLKMIGDKQEPVGLRFGAMHILTTSSKMYYTRRLERALIAVILDESDDRDVRVKAVKFLGDLAPYIENHSAVSKELLTAIRSESPDVEVVDIILSVLSAWEVPEYATALETSMRLSVDFERRALERIKLQRPSQSLNHELLKILVKTINREGPNTELALDALITVPRKDADMVARSPSTIEALLAVVRGRDANLVRRAIATLAYLDKSSSRELLRTPSVSQALIAALDRRMPGDPVSYDNALIIAAHEGLNGKLQTIDQLQLSVILMYQLADGDDQLAINLVRMFNRYNYWHAIMAEDKDNEENVWLRICLSMLRHLERAKDMKAIDAYVTAISDFLGRFLRTSTYRHDNTIAGEVLQKTKEIFVPFARYRTDLLISATTTRNARATLELLEIRD